MSEPSGRTIRVALVAGEASGDLLGAHLLQALSERVPRLEAFGIGGPKMQTTRPTCSSASTRRISILISS
jgi:lipid-A-disaccharide synthase